MEKGRSVNRRNGKETHFFTFINTTYDISLDSQISLLPLGFSPPFSASYYSGSASRLVFLLLIIGFEIKDAFDSAFVDPGFIMPFLISFHWITDDKK